MNLDDTLSEIEKKWPLEKKEAQPASDTKRPMEPTFDSLQAFRVRVAELCGWKRGVTGETYWVVDTAGIRRGWSKLIDVADNALPDYCNDLNACAEFEKIMYDDHDIGDQWTDYVNRLVEMGDDDRPVHATAEQRCRAFVAVMEGAPSVPEGPKSDSAAGVSSTKDSSSPEIVIQSLCKAVRRYERFLDCIDVDFPRAEAVHKCRDDITSILEGKDA